MAPAAQYQGYWQMASLTLAAGGDGGVAPELTRTSSPDSQRGDVSATVLAPNTLLLTGKMALLRNGLLTTFDPYEQTAVLEGNRWLVNTRLRVEVYQAAYAGEQLVLSWDGGDRRNLGASAGHPENLVLRRASAPTGVSIGQWGLVRMDMNGMSITAKTCQQVGGRYQWIDLTMNIDQRRVYEQRIVVRNFTGAGCATEVGAAQTTSLLGFVEEEALKMRLWFLDRDRSQYVEWTMKQESGTLEFTRLACTPGCPADLPTRLVLQRLNTP